MLNEGVGVVLGRQNHYADVHAFFEYHVGASQSGVYAGRVAVIEYCDVFGIAAYHAHLLGGERGA